jgi:hypothetical protein
VQSRPSFTFFLCAVVALHFHLLKDQPAEFIPLNQASSMEDTTGHGERFISQLIPFHFLGNRAPCGILAGYSSPGICSCFRMPSSSYAAAALTPHPGYSSPGIRLSCGASAASTSCWMLGPLKLLWPFLTTCLHHTDSFAARSLWWAP